jgi:5-methylcytosine-specific restriction endonuclease McrA
MTKKKNKTATPKKKQRIPYGAIRSVLKRIWLYSDNRKAALAGARKSRGKYLCAICNNLFGPKEIQVDHRDPVVVGKFIDWNTFIDRLFCEKENLQVLCHECHKAKSDEENKSRCAKD